MSLDRFEPGFVYDVGTTVANLLLAEGWAEPVEDRRPAMVIVLPDEQESKPSILVIDDDDATRALLATLLTVHGYTVRSARDGAEGLVLLQQNAPDLILLDLKMPRMSGAAFRLAQRALPAILSRIPVAIISGTAEAESEAERLDAVAFIGKPINDSELLELVRLVCPATK
jgi:CheY-like chemotaxis protein